MSLHNQFDVIKLITMAMMAVLFILVLLVIITICSILMLWYNKKVPKGMLSLVSFSLRLTYPLLVLMGKLINTDKNSVRRAYTLLNNRLIRANTYHLKGEELLVLTPHCLQKSSCPHKITHDVENCKRCGLCNIHQLMALKDQYNIQFCVVTGGTLARKMILERKPRAIIAIACERDLVSGLMDVKGVPVLAVINQRPQGPCVNTMVDLKEVEAAIQHFIKE
ncbi:DUF116 domain-containing protein [Alkaliphilus crotonatoxidans]